MHSIYIYDISHLRVKTQLIHFTLKIHIKNTVTPLKHKNVCVCFATLHVSVNTLDHLQGLFLF
jgi:hypothetical protein